MKLTPWIVASRTFVGLGLVLTACGGSSSGDGTATEGATTGTDTGTASNPSTSVTQGTTTDSASGPSTTMTTGADTSTTSDTATGSTGSSSSGADESSSSSGGDTGPVVPPCPYEPVAGPSGWALEMVAEDVEEPMFALGHPEEPDRLFVLERAGTIEMIEPGTTTPVVPSILEIEGVENGGESGLFGLAFHPDFPDDPRIYVNYTALPDGRTRINEYTLDPMNNWVGDPDSERLILDIWQPEFNHNGGGIAFDTTGNLLIGMGDGGTQSTSRVTGILLAKFLRIGVDPDGIEDNPEACEGCPQFGPFDYTIPADNPFVGDPDYAPEIFALGFRNPFRWSIDVGTGDIWVGDVGQNAWEEVDLIEAGRDYGWNSMEGFHCYNGDCEPVDPNQTNGDGLTMPLVEISHGGGDCAVVGGAVYRSCQVPEWDGTYLFSDYCNAEVRGLRYDGDNLEELGVLIDPNNGLTGNGWNNWGDVYFTGGSTFNGRVWRVVPVE